VPVGDARALGEALLAALDENPSEETRRARVASVSHGDSTARYLELLLPAGGGGSGP
jgi:hypothetical protein